MDMREASAMTEVSGLTPDQEGVENAVGATTGTAKDMSGNPGPLGLGFGSRRDALLRPVAQTNLRGSATVALDGLLARRPCSSTALEGRGTAGAVKVPITKEYRNGASSLLERFA